ncbi:MAG: superoxide dismutase, partial [Saprospiraceae bacterium]
MEKRTFLKTGLFLGIAAATSSFLGACKPVSKTTSNALSPTLPPPKLKRSTPFTLPPLGYDFAGLEPHIDKLTMEIHHGRHHLGYVNNLNDAVKGTIYAEFELDDIIARISSSESDKKIRNNAGGHWNHSFFWQTIAPGGNSAPSPKLDNAIRTAFVSQDKFKEQFSTAAKGVFGSGWAWLCVDKDKNLFICATPNQDNPLMLNVSKQIGTPIL